MFNCGETVIHKWLHRHNILVRSRSSAMGGIPKSDEHRKKLSLFASKRVGVKNSNWKHGKSKKDYQRRSINYRRRSKFVLERDNYECQQCGLDMELQIHHIKLVKDFPELVNDYNNCITLCKQCHYSLHFPIENSANSAKARTVNAELNSTNPFFHKGMIDKCVETIHGTVSNN